MFFRTESFKDFLRFYPIVTGIIALQLVIWLLTFISPTLQQWIILWGGNFNAAIEAGQFWRVVTSIFIHAPNSFTHVLFNSFSLVLFGPALEQMLGKAKFIFVYLFTGIIGNVFTVLLADPGYFSYGASGAVYGIIGVYIFMTLFRKDLMDPSSSQVIVIIAVIGLLMTFLRPGINIYAHLFGFIAGIALGPVILTKTQPFSPWRNRRRQRDPDEIGFDPNRWKKRRFLRGKNTRNIIWGIIIVLIVLGLLRNLSLF
ncbi:rhomboid protease GlpG [Paraliobacillus ryukyuensis]|uniref:Membrane associated rhomboid family serine protease n=1 Tax=Paraliobacillus ryukyuensis TaxID=200904 RepID=A0A366EBE2_9BACI|nr:rhomboid family intramembrane serine protease [Paraliobacillus ryukyuensis]RBO99703.1 membrane associated rhomboid family serine protease [Paraliobacillus ryukyuensis]